MNQKTLKSLEFNKILLSHSDYAVLDKTKDEIKNFSPTVDFKDACFLLKKTKEAYKLLFTYSVSGVYYFADITEELKRVDVGGTLNFKELLRVSENLKGARILKNSILSINDESLTVIPEIAGRLYDNLDLEKDITSKIISEDEMADDASPKLKAIRRNIRDINAKIRNQLTSYMHGNLGKYLQDGVVTMRGDRYVIPVKSEYRGQIKGFIHDQSSSGATVFIEPEIVIELNNDLKRAMLDEQEEIHKILVELSLSVSNISDALRYNLLNVSDIDNAFARAICAYKNKYTEPVLNDKGITDIKRGRHPLISKDKVVPVSISLGKDYNFLLVTGPNTGGKTVTLKMVGLFSLMAMSGMFIPADDESVISVYSDVFTDIGDEQSIEQDLSTFSSHIKNLIDIINSLDHKSLVLIDEIGAGTDPEEGSALALAIIKRLLESNCFGIITTHYSKLKEFALDSGKIENASMQFDPKTLKPMYKINIGVPGSSNAIDIAKGLGLDGEIIANAISFLSDDKIGFDKVVKKAEEERRKSEELAEELDKLKNIKETELKTIYEEKEKIKIEREKIYANAKAETKRIVADKLLDAEEIIGQLKAILKSAELDSQEVFKANALKNKLKNSKYLTLDDDSTPIELIKPKENELKVGGKYFIKSFGTYAKLLEIKRNGIDADILIGDSIKTVVKVEDLFNYENGDNKSKNVKIFKKIAGNMPKSEINVMGKTSLEAVDEVVFFIDQAVLYNLAEIKIIHGVGEGILLKAIREYLKTDKRVKEFRRGKYGEGENGVTIVTLN